jgi:hypothetical protein
MPPLTINEVAAQGNAARRAKHHRLAAEKFPNADPVTLAQIAETTYRAELGKAGVKGGAIRRAKRLAATQAIQTP